jgi:hypothetical protein
VPWDYRFSNKEDLGLVMKTLRIGQFSQSPVLLAIQHFNLLPEYQLEISNVTSSPSQFESLAKNELDIALTSPDNVLLYGTTDKNALKQKIELKILRSIDKGLKLSLVSNGEIKNVSQLQTAIFSIDSITSGFALLLKNMLLNLKLDLDQEINFVQAGSTPKRLLHVLDNNSQATILNAESKIVADKKSLKTWMEVTQVSNNYLGTVICVKAEDESVQHVKDFMSAWKSAVEMILNFNLEQFKEIFTDKESPLATKEYFELLKDGKHGMTLKNELSVENLIPLIEIRKATHAYTPDISLIGNLISNKYE